MCVLRTRRSARVVRLWLRLALMLPAAASACSPALAQDAPRISPAAPSAPAWEAWVGAEASRHSWSLYSGLTYSPFDTIRADGLRLRAVAGYGRYDYATHRWTGTDLVPQAVAGTTSFADGLIGYHWGSGPLTLKVFAGIATEGHWLTPEDPYNLVQGVGTGAKVLAEGWIDWTADMWSSVDLAWSSLHEGRSMRLRSAYRVVPWIALGVEAGYSGTFAYDEGRAGVFLKADWIGGEITGSAGLAGDRDGLRSPYGTFNWLVRY